MQRTYEIYVSPVIERGWVLGFNLFLAYTVYKPGILGTVVLPETSLQAGLFSLFIHVHVKTSCRERLQLHVSNEVLISGEYKKDISLLQEGEEHYFLQMHSPSCCISILSPSKAVAKLRVSIFMKATFCPYTEITPDIFHAAEIQFFDCATAGFKALKS